MILCPLSLTTQYQIYYKNRIENLPQMHEMKITEIKCAPLPTPALWLCVGKGRTLYMQNYCLLSTLAIPTLGEKEEPFTMEKNLQ